MRTEVIQQKPKRASAQPLLDNSLMISSEERARLSMKSVILPVNPSTVQRRLRTNFEGKRKMNSNAVKFSLDLGTIQGIDEGEFNDGQKKWRLADQRRYVFASIRTLSLSLVHCFDVITFQISTWARDWGKGCFLLPTFFVQRALGIFFLPVLFMKA